jgi:hypothetical protein
MIFNTTGDITIGNGFCKDGCNSLKSLVGGYVSIGDGFGAGGLFSLRYIDLVEVVSIGANFCENGCDNL